MMKHLNTFLLVLSLLFLLSSELPGQEFKKNSVLASGDFYKVRVNKNSIFKIDYDFLKSLGINPTKIDLSRFGVFGTHTGMLKQSNQNLEVDDLEEIPLLTFGLEDQKFDKGDYIIFYGQGAHRHYFDANQKVLKREFNLYDTANYYFITTTNGSLKAIAYRPSLEKSIGTISIYDHYIFHETVNQSIVKSGREWFGEQISSSEILNFSFNLPDLVPHRSIDIQADVLSTTTSKSNLNINSEGRLLGSTSIKGIPQALYGDKGVLSTSRFKLRTDDMAISDMINIAFEFDDQNDGIAYLDKLSIKAPRFITLFGNQSQFESAASLNFGTTAFVIREANPNQTVWDISDPVHPVNQQLDFQSGKGIFRVNTDTYKRFIIFQGDEFPSPTFIEKVEPQNLHGISGADGLIITSPSLQSVAQELADFRRTNDELNIKVVTVDKIYNEYSGGRHDITGIRNFIRSVYLKGQRLENVMLLGEATYNHQHPENLVPTYQSYNSLHNVHSYASDDYYGFMDLDEGDWFENSSTNNVIHDMEIGIGRVPVTNPNEAQTIVDKIIKYETGNSNLGSWRSKVAFVADDGESNKFQLQSDFLATDLEEKRPALSPNRIFVDAFRQDLPVSPVTQHINDQIQNGVLILDFIGHGGETAWTNEGILRISTINDWENENRLPVFLTATCEFGRFDDPDRRSGAETALLKENGGAIALFSTTRPVFLGTNFELSKSFYSSLLENLESTGSVRLGTLMKLTKNKSEAGVVNRNFSLLGDPFLTLAYPKEEMVLTSITSDRGALLDSTFNPLEQIYISGEVIQADKRDEFFNGEAELIIYDVPQKRRTLGEGGPETVMEFLNRDNVLFRGTASVIDGKFRSTFALPLDIDSIPGEAKITMYASDEKRGIDAVGATLKFKAGGTPDSTNHDNSGPTISAYLNHRDFVPGDVVASDPKLFVKLNDENGINLSTRNDRGVKAILDFDQEFDLTPFFKNDLDRFDSGTIEYQLQNISIGKHNLAIEAHDLYNNKTRIEIDFLMVDTSQVVVTALNYFPNPTSDCINFQVEFDNSPADTELDFRLFSNDGSQMSRVQTKLVQNKKGQQSVEVCKSKNGGIIENGLYYFLLQMSPGEARQNRQTGRIIFTD